jgi:site-specific recombinase XerD
MGSIEIVFFKSKTLKNGENPILYRIIKDRKPKYISTGFSCIESEWNFEAKRFNKSHKNYKKRNILLNKKLTQIEDEMLILDGENKNFTALEVVNKYRGTLEKTTVFKYLKSLVERLEKSNKIGNSYIYADLLRDIKLFQNERDLTFSEISQLWLNKYEEYKLGKGCQETTISLYMRTLRATFNKAIKEGFCNASYYPFRTFKISKYDTTTRKRAIKKEEMQRIIDLSLEEGSRIWKSKNYFLFSFFNIGINLIDIAYLKNGNINNGYLQYKRKKTGKEITIKIQPPSEEILKFFGKSTDPEDYIFPILNDEVHRTEESKRERIKKITKYINKDLKEIAEKVKIHNPTSITFYVARHSWATIQKNNGISVSVISESLTHDDEKTTQIYLASFENAIIDNANSTLMK